MRKLNVVGYVPVLGVVLIAACAFVPGFLSQKFVDDLKIDSQKLADAQQAYDYVSSEARYIYDFDSKMYSMAWLEIQEAMMLDSDFSILCGNLTAAENETYVTKITQHVNAFDIMSQQTNSFAIHVHFTETNEETFVIGETAGGYEYNIPKLEGMSTTFQERIGRKDQSS